MKLIRMVDRLNSVSVRKKTKRLMASALLVLMINPLTGYSVVAKAQVTEAITGFVELPEEITTQPETSVVIDSTMMRTPVGESPISIGGTAVDSDDWYALTDVSGTVSTEGAGADNWNIHVTVSDTTATVALKDATIANNSSTHAIEVRGYNLEIYLEGTSNQIGTGITNSNGYAVYNSTDGKDVSIGGYGDLTLTGYYGICINGTGNVTVDIDGSLIIQSAWQMISNSGGFTAEAKNITMDGYYIQCMGESVDVSLTATDEDVIVRGTGDYGIQSGGDITISAPNGGVTVSGKTYSLYQNQYQLVGNRIFVSGKNDVSLMGCVKGSGMAESEIHLISETGDITIQSDRYQAIAEVKNKLELSAPEGDITLAATGENEYVISGSDYALSILAAGTLNAQGGDGITGFSTADIKAQTVSIAANDNGYGMNGGDVSVTNLEGGNCTEISVFGGGGTRNALLTGDLTLKGDKVIVAAASNASAAIWANGDIIIGDVGLIVGGAGASGTTTIADGILQVQASGPDASNGLDLKTDTPTYSVYYKAGDGYALFTPAQEDTPAVLTLHNAEIVSSGTTLNLGAETVIQLEGINRLTSTSTGSSSAISNYSDDWADIIIRGGSEDSLIVSGWQCISVGNLTISGGNVTASGSCYGIVTMGDMLIENSAQVSVTGGEFGYALTVGDYDTPHNFTIRGESSLMTGETNVTGSISIGSGATVTVQEGSTFWADYATAITNNGTIINKGTFCLPYSYTAAQVDALNIPGTIQLYNMDTGAWKVYVNGEFYADGGELDAEGALNLTTPPEEATYYRVLVDNAYIIYTPATGNTNAVLTLHGVNNIGYLQGGIALPDAPVTIHLEESNVIKRITASNTINITGSGRLFSKIVNGNPSAGLIIEDGTIVNVLYQVEDNGVTTYTVYGAYSYSTITVRSNSCLVLAPGAVLTVSELDELVFYENATLFDNLSIGEGASIVNNGNVVLPQGTTAAQIVALPLSGIGIVRVAKAYEGDKPSAYEKTVYTNDGFALNPVGGMGEGLDLTKGDHSGKTVANDSYAWNADSKTLTLGNAFIAGNVTLPAGSIVNTIAPTVIRERIEGEYGTALNITLSGTESLSIGGGISGAINGDTVTVQGGAQVTIRGFVFLGASGGMDGTLNVTGLGTRLTVSSPYGYAVMCDTVNVQNGASLTANGGSIGVEALTGVNVTSGSTLTTNCDYGVYIIDGKLNVDESSKLITNAAVAPFCIVDTTSSKVQSDVLSLAGLPLGTEIASVAGSQAKYWSLVNNGDSLTVSAEYNTPVTLSGAKTGTITFVKASNPDDNGGDNNGTGNNGGGSSSCGSSSGDSSPDVTTLEKKPDQPVIGSVNASGKVSDNHAVIIITDGMVKTAIEKAQSDAKAQGKTANGIGVSVFVSAPGAKSFTIITRRAALNRLVSTNVKLFQIVGLPANTCFNQASLKQQQAQGSGDITMTQKPIKVKKIRNAYDIKLSTVKDKKTVNITSMGKGIATISIPYTLGKNEAVGGLYAVYVDAKGKATRIEGSAYDANSGCVIFTTTHFSQYGIGYTAPTAKFTDVTSHWAKDSIDYVVSRGLLSGTSKTAFSPNSFITREMFVTALGKLAGVDTKEYTENSFTDVKPDSAYRSYIEWAYKKGIIQGIKDSQFAPDKAITREEIAAIFVNYAKATGYTLPITREAITYADAANIDSAYIDAVKAVQQAGIMMGGSNNTFNPKRNATRAEVSSMLSRYIKLTINPVTAQGWAQNDAGQYLYYNDGVMVSGKWLEIDGKWYYFYSDGSLARNIKVDGYEVDENGVRKIK